MSDQNELGPRQALLVARATTITEAQIRAAMQLASEVFDVAPEEATQDLILKITKIMAINYHASVVTAAVKAI